MAREKRREKRNQKTAPAPPAAKVEVQKVQNMNLLKNNALDDDLDIFADAGKLDFSGSADLSKKAEGFQMGDPTPSARPLTIKKEEEEDLEVRNLVLVFSKPL